MLGECDVVVSDGFSGNVALKSMEGSAKLVLGVMKKELSSSLSSKIGYLFMRKALKRMRAQLDFDKAGGALLLGLKKPVVKSHGFRYLKGLLWDFPHRSPPWRKPNRAGRTDRALRFYILHWRRSPQKE